MRGWWKFSRPLAQWQTRMLQAAACHELVHEHMEVAHEVLVLSEITHSLIT